MLRIWGLTDMVNGACGMSVVDTILKPNDDLKPRIVMVNLLEYVNLLCRLMLIQSVRPKDRSLSLSWVVTIHKTPGMRIDRVAADLSHGEFAAGVTFVALSRAKPFDGLTVFALTRIATSASGMANTLMRD